MATTDSTRETEKRVSAGAFEHLVAGHRMADSFDEELRVRKKGSLQLVVSPLQAVLVAMVFAILLAANIVSAWYFLTWESEWLHQSTGLFVTGAGIIGGVTITAVLLIIMRLASLSLHADHNEALNRFYEAEREFLAEIEDRQRRNPNLRNTQLAGE